MKAWAFLNYICKIFIVMVRRVQYMFLHKSRDKKGRVKLCALALRWYLCCLGQGRGMLRTLSGFTKIVRNNPSSSVIVIIRPIINLAEEFFSEMIPTSSSSAAASAGLLEPL